MNHLIPSAGLRRIILGLLLGGLLVLAYAVLKLFLVPVAWAAIVAYTTWPVYTRLKRALGGRATLSAVLMSLLLMATFVLPLLWLVAMLRTELVGAYSAVAAYLEQGPRPLPTFVAAIPWVGDWLQQLLDQVARNPAALREQIGQWLEQRTDDLLELLGGVGRNAAKLGFAMVTVLFPRLSWVDDWHRSLLRGKNERRSRFGRGATPAKAGRPRAHQHTRGHRRRRRPTGKGEGQHQHREESGNQTHSFPSCRLSNWRGLRPDASATRGAGMVEKSRR